MELPENLKTESDQLSPLEESTKTKLASLGLGTNGIKNFLPKKKIIWSIFALIVILISVPVAIFLAGQKQEIRKEAQENPTCQNGYETCKQDPYNCPDLPPYSHETWDSCGVNPDEGGRYIHLERPTSSCRDGKHVFEVVVKKYDLSDILILHTKTNLYTCDEACGHQKNEEGRCVCFQNLSVVEKDEFMPATVSEITITREVPLIGGNCGSAQIDLFIPTITANGNEMSCPLRSDRLCNNWPNCGGPWTVWFSGLDSSQCGQTTPTPTPIQTITPVPARCYQSCPDDAFCNPDPTVQTPEQLVCGTGWCEPEQECNENKCYNQNCPKDTDCTCPVNIPVCNDACKTDADCLNPTGSADDQMICFKPDWCDQGVCRNKNCPRVPDCNCDNAFKLKCVDLKAYTSEWIEITDFSTVSAGDEINFLVMGLMSGSGEIDKAIFRVNDGDWMKPSGKKESNFYFTYEIPDNGHYQVEAMVHSPDVGWR